MRLRVLVATAAIPLVLWAALPLLSEGATGKAGQVTRKLEIKRKALERNRARDRVLTTDVSAFNRRIGALQGEITSLQRRQRDLRAELAHRRSGLVRTQEGRRGQPGRWAKLRGRLDLARRVGSARLVEIYESDEPDISTVILQSDGFAQLLERAEYLSRVNDQDARVIDAVRTAKADATSTTRRLAGLQARQQRITAEVLARRNQVATARESLANRRARFAAARA